MPETDPRALQNGRDDYPGARIPLHRRRNPIPYIILAIVLIIIAYAGANVWLNWTILEYMYSSKAGLDWFGVIYYGGLTFVVGGILALLFVNPIPRRSDTFEAFNALMGLQYRNPYMGSYGGSSTQSRRIKPLYIRPSKTLWAFWQAVKWVILFGIFSSLNGFPGLGNLTILIDLTLRGYGNWSDVPRIFLLPVEPASGATIINLIPAMEIQYWILVYFGIVIMIVLAIRFFLKFVRDAVIRAGEKWMRDIFVSLSAITFAIIIQAPYWPMDITIGYEVGAIGVIFAAFFILAIYFHVKATRDTIPLGQAGMRRRSGSVIVAAVIILILLFNIGAITYYRLNWNNNWTAYQWQPLTQKQIAVTRYSAGIQNVSYSSIGNIPSGNISKTLSLIRQWDGPASQTQSRNQIGVNWETLVPNPEIVYVYDHEYWVNPTTFNYPDTTDWISTHLIYSHTSKIIVMDSHTGAFVNSTQAFRLSNQPLMYYGEGFSNDVYVRVPTEPGEIGGVVYPGAPDYTLCGAQRSVWFFSQGQVGFAFTPPADCIQMLHDRDVFNRVQNILISGLAEDTATYLVTDSAAGGNNLYYAIQVYIDYPLHTAFAQSDYLRFFGVVLVNIQDGSMKGYVVGQNDGFLTSFYKQYYPSWGQVPSWLQSQLRYPEELLGNENSAGTIGTPGQLDADFMYHVQDSSVFRGQSDFFERPSTNTTQVLYIPFAVGNNVSFAAVQLVEFTSSPGKNLAGVYVVYGGGQLGQTFLYQSNSTTLGTIPLIGPTAALNLFKTDSATKTAMTLTGATAGNILLYPVNGHLYYFIPAYIVPSSGGGSVAEKNPFIDVIDAQNPNAPVRFVNTTSSLDQTYGFSTGPIITNATFRATYVQSLFASAGVTVQNVTTVNTNSPIVQNLGTVQFISGAQNSSATSFVNSFINGYVKNSSITGGSVAYNRVFTWSPVAGTLNFGFFVSNMSVVELYYISINVGV